MSNSSTTSTKPYLFRAIFDWANDNGFTPQVLVNAELDGVEVPVNHVVDGQIVLNISLGAIKLHVMDNECLNFSARFSGVEQDIFLPMDAILAIFARENSRGIFFEDGHDSEGDLNDETSASAEGSLDSKVSLKDEPSSVKVISTQSGRAKDKKDPAVNKSRDTSHLKIIK